MTPLHHLSDATRPTTLGMRRKVVGSSFLRVFLKLALQSNSLEEMKPIRERALSTKRTCERTSDNTDAHAMEEGAEPLADVTNPIQVRRLSPCARLPFFSLFFLPKLFRYEIYAGWETRLAPRVRATATAAVTATRTGCDGTDGYGSDDSDSAPHRIITPHPVSLEIHPEELTKQNFSQICC